MDDVKINRRVLRSNFTELQSVRTDQAQGRPQPPLEKPYDGQTERVALPKASPALGGTATLYACLKRRRSRRAFGTDPLTLDELAYLLWATQGVQRVFGQHYTTFRPAPSGGGRHPFETYLLISRVNGLEPGLYRYLPLTHQLLVLLRDASLAPQMTALTLGQAFVGEAPVVFCWSCIPYRTEWRYHTAAAKLILLDAGHLCQNLYLAAEALGLGTCAIASYDQQGVDRLLRLDGVDEFIVYLAPVGRVK
jgi:SagB-type dehydrogenase family enzyme